MIAEREKNYDLVSTLFVKFLFYYANFDFKLNYIDIPAATRRDRNSATYRLDNRKIGNDSKEAFFHNFSRISILSYFIIKFLVGSSQQLSCSFQNLCLTISFISFFLM